METAAISAPAAIAETGTVTPVPAAALAYKQQKQAQRQQLAGQPADAAQALLDAR